MLNGELDQMRDGVKGRSAPFHGLFKRPSITPANCKHLVHTTLGPSNRILQPGHVWRATIAFKCLRSHTRRRHAVEPMQRNGIPFHTSGAGCGRLRTLRIARSVLATVMQGGLNCASADKTTGQSTFVQSLGLRKSTWRRIMSEIRCVVVYSKVCCKYHVYSNKQLIALSPRNVRQGSAYR